MKTFKNWMVFLFAGIMMTGCDKVSYRKTPGGMPYQLYKGKGNQKVVAGNIMKLSFTRKIHDSVYFSTAGKLSIYIPVKEEIQPYDISEVWTKLKVGDSIVTTQMIDTFIKRSPMNVPPELKKGMRMVSYVKVLGVFTSDSAAAADEEKGKKALLKEEVAFLSKYLSDKNISAQKTNSGVFVQMINPGEGNPIDSGKSVTINYTGTSFSGKRFDSNTDTSFHHPQPITFTTGRQEMQKGFDEAVSSMKKGSTARVYIPSMLMYGPSPTTPLIKPFEHLIFDIEVLDVKDPVPVKPQQQQQPPKKTNGAQQ